MGEVYNITY